MVYKNLHVMVLVDNERLDTTLDHIIEFDLGCDHLLRFDCTFE